MIESEIGPKYLLLLRDDLSSYVWLFPFAAANAENAAEAILECTMSNRTWYRQSIQYSTTLPHHSAEIWPQS
eukprot:IDg4347t1